MSTVIKLQLDLSKIDKSKIIEGKKGKYVDLTISVNDESNDYGQNVSAWHKQSKEEREAKESKIYVGNGAVIWTDGIIALSEKPEATEKPKAKAKAKTSEKLPWD